MKWVTDLVESYLKDRDVLLKSRWLTCKSWNKRSKSSTRYQEISRLLLLESDFNKKWISEVQSSKSKLELKKEDICEAQLLIDTHIKKHKERGFFLVVFAALIAGSLKLFGFDVFLSILMFASAFLIAGERLFTSNVTTALDELKSIIELATKET